MADKSLAKALKRKMGLDEEILAKTHAIKGGVSLLMNGTRRMVFEYVCNVPCSHLRAISRGLDLSPQSVRWHLLKLKGGKLISLVQKGKKTLYFPFNNIIGPRECRVLHIMGEGDAQTVYTFIAHEPEKTQKEMGKSLNIYQQKLSIILLQLEGAGLIAHEKRGRENVYSVTEKAGEIALELDGKSPLYERTLMSALARDGLSFTLVESDENVMIFQLEIGEEQRPALKVYKNPLRAILEGRKP